MISPQEYLQCFVDHINNAYPEFFLRYIYVKEVHTHIIFNTVLPLALLINTLNETESQTLIRFVELYPDDKLVFSEVGSPLDLPDWNE